MIVCGIVGARLFYIVQKPDQFFAGASFQEGLIKALKMTEGGLVVYGSLIGGMLAAVVYCRIKKLPFTRNSGRACSRNDVGAGAGTDRMLDERMLLWRSM